MKHYGKTRLSRRLISDLAQQGISFFYCQILTWSLGKIFFFFCASNFSLCLNESHSVHLLSVRVVDGRFLLVPFFGR